MRTSRLQSKENPIWSNCLLYVAIFVFVFFHHRRDASLSYQRLLQYFKKKNSPNFNMQKHAPNIDIRKISRIRYRLSTAHNQTRFKSEDFGEISISDHVSFCAQSQTIERTLTQIVHHEHIYNHKVIYTCKYKCISCPNKYLSMLNGLCRFRNT